jgi:hypothetical protein
LFSWQDVLTDVLTCIESRQDVSNNVMGDVMTYIEILQDHARMYCRLYCSSNKLEECIVCIEVKHDVSIMHGGMH